jgi:hypothetical protein
VISASRITANVLAMAVHFPHENSNRECYSRACSEKVQIVALGHSLAEPSADNAGLEQMRPNDRVWATVGQYSIQPDFAAGKFLF